MIFLSASGAIGKPLIAALVAAKNSVIGMTTNSVGIQALSERGQMAAAPLDNNLVEQALKRAVLRRKNVLTIAP